MFKDMDWHETQRSIDKSEIEEAIWELRNDIEEKIAQLHNEIDSLNRRVDNIVEK